MMTARSFASALWSSVTTPTASTVSTSTEPSLLRLRLHPTNNPTMCSPLVTFAQKTGRRLSRSLKVDTPSSILPLKGEEERHRLMLNATQALRHQPPTPPLKCYLCSRSKVLPMFQVAHEGWGEG